MLREYTIKVEREADGRFVTSLTDSDHGYGLTSRADTQEEALGILGLLLDRLTDATDADEDGLPVEQERADVATAPFLIERLLQRASSRGESVYINGTKTDGTQFFMRLIKPRGIWFGKTGGTYCNFIDPESGGMRTLVVDRMTRAEIA